MPLLTSSDELQISPPESYQTRRNSREFASFGKRACHFTPGLMLRIFAIVKFFMVVYLVFNRPLNDKEVPIVVIILGLDTLLLLSSTTQDFFTLIACWVCSCTQLIFFILLLICVPIFVTSFFASGADRVVNVPHEWKIFKDIVNYQGEATRFQKGIEYGISVEIALAIIVIVAGIQFGLLNATLNAKLDHMKRRKQLREKRSSVYIL